MRLDVRDVAGHPGLARIARFKEPLEGLRLDLAKVDDPLDCDLKLDGVEDGVIVSGRLRGRATFTCARCLREFASPVDLEVRERYSVAPGDDDYPLDSKDGLDPEPMIRDALIPSLPFSPLHSEDCRGLCPVCGTDRNESECGHEQVAGDPRWDVIKNLFEHREG